jgi:hypothetical protein
LDYCRGVMYAIAIAIAITRTDPNNPEMNQGDEIRSLLISKNHVTDDEWSYKSIDVAKSKTI